MKFSFPRAFARSAAFRRSMGPFTRVSWLWTSVNHFCKVCSTCSSFPHLFLFRLTFPLVTSIFSYTSRSSTTYTKAAVKFLIARSVSRWLVGGNLSYSFSSSNFSSAVKSRLLLNSGVDIAQYKNAPHYSPDTTVLTPTWRELDVQIHQKIQVWSFFFDHITAQEFSCTDIQKIGTFSFR